MGQLRAGGWGWWLARRLASGLAVVAVVSVVVFLATAALPSDPARVILGPQAAPGTVHALRHQLGLDRPVAAQYLSWLGKALRGDLGRSLDSQQAVAGLLGHRLANSLTLLALVALLAVPAAVAGGVLLALRQGRASDRAGVVVLIALLAVPSFVLGTALVLLLSTSVLHLLPATAILEPGRSALSQPEAIALPVLTLALPVAAYLTRLVRAALVEALAADYVVAARLRGVGERRILWRHALPNAVIPAIQGMALMLSVLVGGTLVVEATFVFPGMGTLLNAAVGERDLPVIQAAVLVIAAGVVLVNLLADLLTTLLTPRLRTAVAAR